MPRFADAVHITNPKTRTPEFFLKGQVIPEWAFDLIGDHLIGAEPEEPKITIRETTPTDTETEEEREAKLQARAALKAELEAKAAEADASDEDDEDEDDDDAVAEGYAGWTNEALREELINRSLPVGGKKAELVARLTEDDE